MSDGVRGGRRWMSGRAVLLTASLACLVSSPALAQFGLPDEYSLPDVVQVPLADESTLQIWRTTKQWVEQEEWTAAAPLLVQLLNSRDGGLIPVEPQRRYAPVYVAAGELLQGAPEEVQEKVDQGLAPEQTKFDRASEQWDLATMRSTARRLAATSRGLENVLLVAATEMQSGKSSAAASTLRTMLNEPSTSQRFPAEQQAAAWAYLVLAERLAGRTQAAGEAKAKLAADFPTTSGRLGLRSGPWAELLQDSTAAVHVEPDSPNNWSTFGGEFETQPPPDKAAPLQIEHLLWSAPLYRHTLTVRSGRNNVSDEAASSVVHPIFVSVAGSHLLLWQDAQGLHARDAAGAPAWGDGASDLVRSTDLGAFRFSGLGRRVYTLNAAGPLALLRVGSPVSYRPPVFYPAKTASQIECVDLSAEGRLLLRLPAVAEEGEFLADRWAFEAAPVADDDALYVAMRRGGVRAESYVAAYALHDGRMSWRTRVAAAATPGRRSIARNDPQYADPTRRNALRVNQSRGRGRARRGDRRFTLGRRP